MQSENVDRKSRMISYVLVLILLVGCTAYVQVFKQDNDSAARIQLSNEGSIILTDSQGRRETILYADILYAELLSSPDYGAPVTGGLINGVREGVWQSNVLGEYTASAAENIDCAVLIRTAEKIYAVNLESEAVTRSFSDALKKTILENASVS